MPNDPHGEVNSFSHGNNIASEQITNEYTEKQYTGTTADGAAAENEKERDVELEGGVPAVTVTPHITAALAGAAADQENMEDDSAEKADEEEEAEGIFREFTEQSYEQLIIKELERLRKEETRHVNKEEAHLVDGEIVFDDVDEEAPKITRDPKLADGQPLPEKLGRFPRELDGIALEEIDPNIQEKVNNTTLCD